MLLPRNLKSIAFALCVMGLALNSKAQTLAANKHADTVRLVNPPLLNFYSKYVDCDGIPVRSAAVVDDGALLLASAKIRMMLMHMPAARRNLVLNGAEMHIIGRNQVTSDLPEFADQKGVKYEDHGVITDIDARTRGMGGLAASCGEENLLHLPGDRYADGYDICIHEFAHTLMNYGLDSLLRSKIKHTLEQAKAKGMWKDAYAVSNKEEYWAELSMWYFGYNGEFVHGTRTPSPGAASLRAFDPAGFRLLDSIYSGKLQPAPQKRQTVMVYKGATPGHSAEPTSFTFTNLLNTSVVNIYKIDYKGNETLRASVKPKQHFFQKTYMSAVWKFESADGKITAYMRIFYPPNEINFKD